MDKAFNLLYEPWILVQNREGKQEKLSILETFCRAHELQGIAGELPTQDIAILRLLLAIMYGTFVDENMEEAKDAEALWQDLWKQGKFPMEKIQAYLKPYEDRFWLIHPVHPFYQSINFTPILHQYRKEHDKRDSGKETVNRIARMIGDLSQSNNAQRLFPGRTGNWQKVLSWDEAARWLLHVNGYDDNAGKNPTPKVIGYLGQLGLIYAKGHTLFETLLLNFVLADQHEEVVADNRAEAKAWWEKDEQESYPTVEHLIAQPQAIKELYTLQSRRILLKWNDKQQVIGYLSTMGDYFDPAAGMLAEPMTLWKRGLLDKKTKREGFVPLKHLPARQVWRDFSSLISIDSGRGDNLASGVIRWLKELEEQTDFSPDMVNLVTVGIYYEFKGTTWMITDVVHDSLQMSGELLSSLKEKWVGEIVYVLAQTDQAVSAAGTLAVRMISDLNDGNKRKNAKQKELMQCYSQLDEPFRQWLRDLDPEQDSLEEKLNSWKQVAQKLILAEGRRLMNTCNDSKVLGLISAYRKFTGSVRKALA